MTTAKPSGARSVRLRVLMFVEEDIPAILMSVIVVALTADVVGRYVFNHPIQSAAEISLISFIWVIYLSAAAVARKGQHITIDVLTQLFSARWQAIVSLFVQLVTLAVMAYLIWNGFDYFLNGTFTKLTGTGLSKKFLELAIPVSAVLMTAYACRDLVAAVKGAISGNFAFPEEDVEDEYAAVDDSYLPDSLKEKRTS